METNARHRRIALITLTVAISLCVAARPMDAQILSTQISSAPLVNSNVYVNVPGLFLTLPPKSTTQTFALIIYDVPMPYASGNNFPGIVFGINVMGTIVAEGGFTYSQQAPQSFGRMPTTVVVRVPLTLAYQTVWGQWRSVRNSTAHIDSFASLSAVIGK